LADHVAGAAPERGMVAHEPLDASRRRVAERADPEPARRLVAFRSPHVVRTGRVLVPDARVDDDEREIGRQRDALDRERARVDEEHLTIATEARRELIHRSHTRPDELALRAMSEARDREVVEREGVLLAERAQHG